ncbi:MAG TPA: SusC/RagA family TonB-linked outer membrane protein [Flavisolibacter sp.]|jgi:TonB-linked SusC/RagA family outer membrane protein|nr:SusC/RagA family TonB-linked outer membrane protein [Flavisolibacter sp.]
MRKILIVMLSMLLLNLQLLAQNRTITGTVTDASGAPVSGASVIIKNTSVGTVTKTDGTYSISVPANGRILVISAVGQLTQEVTIGNKSTITVTLRSNDQNMQAVVVTGYSRERKSTFVGAATTLSSKVVENVPVASVDQMFQGRVPGLLANSGSGQPGANANVRIRGTSSLGGQTQPLYVVDGVPLASGDLATLNPNDFESVTVLKDANASALYGARGGLGVIVITTKRGRAGQTNVTFKNQFGFTQRPQPSQFNQFNSQQMLEYEEFVGGFANGLVAPGWTYSKKNPAYAGLPTTSPASNPFAPSQGRYDFLRDSFSRNNLNYYDLLFRTGTTRNSEINLSGGTVASRYFASLANFRQEGTDRKSYIDRYTLRFNLDNTIGKFTTQLSSLVSYSKTNWNEGTFYASNGTANPFAMVWRAKPYENPYDPKTDTLLYGTSSALSPKALANLIERSNNSTWVEKQIKANAGLTVIFRPIAHLTLRNTVGVDALNDQGETVIKAGTFVGSAQLFSPGGGPLSTNGAIQQAVTNRLQLINTSGIIYANRFGDKHDMEIGGYFEAVRQWNSGFNFNLFLLDPRLNTGQNLGQLPASVNPTAQQGGTAKSGFGIRSFFANGRYTFDNKYTLSGSVRKDGTSRIINEDNREIISWAAGASWDALREDFLRNQSIFTTLRLRGSYGIVPNIGSIPGGTAYGLAQTGANSFWFTTPKYLGAQEVGFNTVNFAGSGIAALAPTVANPALRIESVEKANIGLDLGFLKNRVQLTVEAYRNVTKDLFVQQTLPATSGFYGTPFNINAGSMENKGLEFDLSVDLVRTINFDVNVRANHAINKNKILDLGTVTEYPSGTAIVRKGLPVGSHYSYAYLGADPATGRPIYKRADGTPTTNLSEAGQFAEFGTHLPVHTGGFSATFRYKQLTLDAFFSYQFDVRRYNNVQNWVTQGDLTFTGAVTQSQILLTEQWRKPGDVKMLQSPAYSRQFTSYDISDAKFMRFRNLNLTYNLPGLTIGKTSIIKGARIYAQAQNLIIWSPWSGLDPEDSDNLSLAEFPNPRAVVFGLDINF